MDPAEFRDPEIILESLTAFFVVLVTALIFSALFRRFKVPWAVALILGGIALGPQGLGWFEPGESLLFMAEIGVIFLMFIAGMETKISSIKEVWWEAFFVGTISGLVPALVGLLIGIFFDLGIEAALLLAIIFMSSSFAVVIPTLEARGVIHYRLGKIIVASTMLQDIASLIILAIFLQFISPEETPVSFPVLMIIVAAVFAAGYKLKRYVPRFRKWLQEQKKKTSNRYRFERELRMAVAVLIGASVVFEFFRMETIVGAFFAGLLLSEVISSKVLENKIHVLGYGIFIPVFFVTIGGWTNVSLLVEEASKIWPLVFAIILGSALTKFASGFLASRWLSLSTYQSSLVGVTSVPQLITTLAVVLVGQGLGILDEQLSTAIIMLSIVTTLVSPMITGHLLRSKPDNCLKEGLEVK